jgi:hypothetical protein
MAGMRVDWLGLAGAFVRVRPKASIAIAFELGMLAAQVLTKNKRIRGVSNISSSLIDLVPSIADIGGMLPEQRRAPAPKRSRKTAVKRAPRIKKPL